HVDGTYMAVFAYTNDPSVPAGTGNNRHLVGIPVLILPLASDSSYQVVDSNTLNISVYATDIQQDVRFNGNSFSLTLSCGFSFSLSYDLYEAHQKSHYTSTGGVTFGGPAKMQVQGVFPNSGNASLTKESISLTQEMISSSISATYQDTSV